MPEPAIKRAVSFFDGQNLFRHAKDAFGHIHPNYDPKKLTDRICQDKGWVNFGVRFYTGIPTYEKSKEWHGYWSNRLLAMRRSGILVESREIKYRTHEVKMPDGTIEKINTSQEKGIDIKIALDVIRMAISNQLDVAILFSQDQDLAEVVSEVRDIASLQKRWIKVVSAFPSGPKATSLRGINNSDWIKLDQELYNSCLDLRDYRPKNL